MAASRRREEVFARRGIRAGDDTGEAIRRLAHEPDSARQLDQRSPAGRTLPKPPKGVPPLPDDEAATEGLTVRQLVEKHVSDPKCAVCHQRIDPFGFSLEAFDAIGRHRDKDLGNRPIDTQVTAMDGASFDGLDGLRNYLLTKRRDAFLRQFCRKLLGYSLGRSVQLSDEPLLTEMQNNLTANDYKVGAAIEAIVHSRQFREIRGSETAFDE